VEVVSKPNAIELLQENQDKIDWWRLSRNSSIFTYEYDYEHRTETTSMYKEDLIAAVFHPRRFEISYRFWV